MKKRILRFMVCVVALTLVGGVGGTCFADDATEVVIQVSYPNTVGDFVSYFNGVVGDIDDFADRDYYVNVHITLKDANGDPATTGPGGEDLTILTATLTTELGKTGSISENQFLDDSNSNLNFASVDPDVGPAARAHVRYACTSSCEPGTDTLEVTVGTLTGTAEVDVRAPKADSLAIRTPGTASITPSDLFDAIPAQSNNNSTNAKAGASIPFEVYAVEGVGGEFTFAPELDGVAVTVNAYADYDASGNVGDYTGEATAVGSATTATFSDGVATGEIMIEKAGTLDDGGNARLKVVLTADANPSTTLIAADPPATDASLDWVGMISGDDVALVIGKEASGGAYNLIEAVDVWYILDDNTTGPTSQAIGVFVVDSYGNPCTKEPVDIEASVTRSGLAADATIYSATGPLTSTATAHSGWDVQDGVPGNVNPVVSTMYKSGGDNQQEKTGGGGGSSDRGKPIQYDLTLADITDALTPDSTTIWLVRTSKGESKDLDLRLDTDKPNTQVAVGDTVTLYITSASGSAGNPTTSEIVEGGDDLEIQVKECSSGTAMKITPGSATDNSSAVKTLEVNAPTPKTGTKEIQIPIKIWGACSQSDPRSLCVTLTDKDKGIENVAMYDKANRSISKLLPGAESQIWFSSLPVGHSGGAAGLEADPVVITSQFQVDTDYSLLTTASVDTADAYGNVINDTPSYGTSGNGVGAVSTADKATTIRFDAADIGQTAIVTVSSGSLPDRQLQIDDIVAAATAGALMCELEGPAAPVPGGEAIVLVQADGAFAETPKTIQVDIDETNSVADSQIRDLGGAVLTPPASSSLASGAVYRLVASAPEEGDVVLEIGDISPGHTTLLDTATCTIHFGPLCDPVVTVTPASASIESEGTQQFTASTACAEGGDPPNTPVYTWEISVGNGTGTACSGSTISATGLYTAPSVTEECSDTVKATDTANGDAEGTASVTVGPPVTITTTTSIGPDTVSIVVNPDTIQRSSRRNRMALLRIRGTNTNFSRDSVVSVSPAGEVELGAKLRLSRRSILQIVRVLPGEAGATVTVTVTTGTEVASDEVTIEMGRRDQ